MKNEKNEVLNEKKLMNKTKKELVAIIFRKDDVERKIANNNVELATKNTTLVAANEQLQKDNAGYMSQLDEFAVKLMEAQTAALRNKRFAWGAIILFIITIVAAIIIG